MHFLALVLLPKDTSPDTVEAAIEKVLAPYSEHLDVAPYEEECWCVGSNVYLRAKEMANEATGRTLEEFRAAYRELAEACQQRGEKPSMREYDYEEPWRAARRKACRELTDAREADPGCEECHGTGRRTTTANPNGHWDWYQVGGRWSGLLDKDYDPETDENNIEVCWLCGGTGVRADAIAIADPKSMAACNGCNGCHGAGKHVKWPTSWVPFAGDVAPATVLTSEHIPYALVTPDGVWHEGEEVYWRDDYDGLEPDETDRYRAQYAAAWNAEALRLIEAHRDTLVAVVDCHT